MDELQIQDILSNNRFSAVMDTTCINENLLNKNFDENGESQSSLLSSENIFDNEESSVIVPKLSIKLRRPDYDSEAIANLKLDNNCGEFLELSEKLSSPADIFESIYQNSVHEDAISSVIDQSRLNIKFLHINI